MYEPYVEVEFAVTGSVHQVSQNDVSVRCKARNANGVTMNISIVGILCNLSLKMTSRQAISAVFPSSGPMDLWPEPSRWRQEQINTRHRRRH